MPQFGVYLMIMIYNRKTFIVQATGQWVNGSSTTQENVSSKIVKNALKAFKLKLLQNLLSRSSQPVVKCFDYILILINLVHV